MCEVAHKHAENGGTAADVEDYFVLEQVPILVYRVAIGPRAHFVFLEKKRHGQHQWSGYGTNQSNLPTFLHECLFKN
jgi:hypothetical protein